MEKLNEYLKTLLSSCSEELRLEPDKNPYLVSANRITDVANVPLLGTQISTMVFPLIPSEVKSALPNSNQVEFVHPNNLGNFNFIVQKSPAGFVVTIRPIISDAAARMPEPLPEAPPEVSSLSEMSSMETVPSVEPTPAPSFGLDDLAPVPSFELDNSTPVPSFEVESAAMAYDLNTGQSVSTTPLPNLVYEQPKAAEEYIPSPDSQVEVVSVNDPEFQTVFSDTSTYEPPGHRSDLMNDEYRAPAEKPAPAVDAFSSSAFEASHSAPPSDPPPAAAPMYTPQPDPAPAYNPVHQEPATQAFTPPPAPPQQAYSYEAMPPAAPSFVPATANPAMTARMDSLFHQMAELGASDLHLSVSMPPMVRKDGKIRPLNEGEQAFTAETMREMLHSIMPPSNQEEFARRHDTDFAYEIQDLARFRCNVFMDRKGMGGVFRIIPAKMTTAEQLGLSQAILGLCELSKGLVVVTGPTGSGKSTTLCGMVNYINMRREDHIITIEDPIEFVHQNIKCLVNQREVHNHTDSFKDALRAALREDPDILLVGEMRDLETISIAIETAETGHLVFGTLHTTTAASTVDRIIDQFPADRQQQIRVMLSESLKGVIAQTLLPKKGGGRVAALEVLIVTPAISNLIREGKTFQIPSAMQTGKAHGMVMLNEALFEHVQNGVVEPLDAYIKAVDKTGFEAMLTRAGFKI